LNNENQIFNNLSESEKLSYILNPSTPSQVNTLGENEKVSRHLYTYSESINVALSEYLSQKEGKTIRTTIP
jgi:hypothetical protein